MTIHLKLVVPGLCLPRQMLRDLSFDLPLPGLRGLLAASTPLHDTATSIERLVAAACRPESVSAAAALRMRALGGDPGAATWICLDPVHLAFNDRHLVVQDPSVLDLSLAEAQQLASELAPHFARLGDIDVTRPGQWHMRLTASANSFPALDTAIGARASMGLPKDPLWRQVLNDAQISLHHHPVNLQRSAQNRPVINSLWPWGAGALPEKQSSLLADPMAVHTHDAVLRGLTLQMGHQAAAPASTFSGIDFAQARRQLLHLVPLRAAASSADANAWRECLVALDEQWFSPLLAGWQASQPGPIEVQLFFPGASSTQGFRLSANSAGQKLFSALRPLLTRLGRAAPAPQLDHLADA